MIFNALPSSGPNTCTLSYSFDDEPWWEKLAYKRGTKWVNTMEEIKEDVERQMAKCCCIEEIYLTQHSGVPGVLQMGDGMVSANIIQIINNETDKRRREQLEKALQRERDFLSYISKKMCPKGKVYFVSCQVGKGPEGEDLRNWLGSIFPPETGISLPDTNVRWFYGDPITCSIEETR